MSDYKRNPRSARRARKSLSRKAVVVLSLMMVLVLAAVGGTVAWLTDNSGPVTNTFTVGDINIELTETWNADGPDEDTVPDHWEGKVVPGATDTKDPKVTVAEGSEKCYVYVTVENNLVLEDGTLVASLNIDASKWVSMGTAGNKTLYKYYQIVDAMNADVELPVFTTVTYSGTDITKGNINQLSGKTIVVNAYAHQSDTVSADDADAAARTWAGVPAVTP